MSGANPRSTLTVGRRPLHAVLVPIPIVCFVATLVTDIVYWRTAAMLWADMSAWLLLVGLIVSAFAAAGFGVVTFSVRGYALSDGPADFFDVQTDQAIEDLAAVVDWVRAGIHSRPHLLGWSWGGRIIGRYAEEPANASKVDRLVMLDPALGGGNKILPVPTDPVWQNTYDYFKDRLVAEYADPEVQELLARRMAEHELHSPNGIRMENAHGSKAVDPVKVTRPTMMQYGIKAGGQNYMQGGWDRLEFFKTLPTDDKCFFITPRGGDYAHLELGRKHVFDAAIMFLQTDSL